MLHWNDEDVLGAEAALIERQVALVLDRRDQVGVLLVRQAEPAPGGGLPRGHDARGIGARTGALRRSHRRIDDERFPQQLLPAQLQRAFSGRLLCKLDVGKAAGLPLKKGRGNRSGSVADGLGTIIQEMGAA
jgi:hypothetical protein